MTARFLDYVTDTGVKVRIRVNYQDPDISEAARLSKGGWTQTDQVACYPFVTNRTLKPRKVLYIFNGKPAWVYVKTLALYNSIQKEGIEKVKGYKGEQTTNCIVLNV